MFKRFLIALTALLAFSLSAFATDVNTASQAELESIQGIGPSTASKILDERKQGSFKDWPDLLNRVKGLGTTSANRLSTRGLTVNGVAYVGTKTPETHSKSASAVATTASAAPAATLPTADKKVSTLVKTNTLSAKVGTAASAASGSAAASSAKK